MTADEIMALADQASDDRHMCGSPTYNAQAAQSRNTLKQAVEALAKDAARYQWWRNLFADDGSQLTQEMIDADSPGTIDEAIDKAIEAAQAEQT